MKFFIKISLLILWNATVTHAQYKTELYVGQDGSSEFTSIQDAIDHTKCFPDVRITIFIKPGIYQEKVKVHWSTPDNEMTAFYAEYENTGPGADPTKRVAWSHQLSKCLFGGRFCIAVGKPMAADGRQKVSIFW
ncbi:MAG: hypothetical protein DHS20C18_23620 [Saprospiraceae bacterium]|nr:MAG: hypothetical protein DHS20C18_23620 [Saprospiraceae bacterium]